MIDFTDVYDEAYVDSCCEHSGADDLPATIFHEDAIRAVVAAAKAEALAEITTDEQVIRGDAREILDFGRHRIAGHQ